MLEMIGAAASTLKFSVAVFDKLPASVTLTTKLFGPTFADTGMPERLPELLTLNHPGPLTSANVRVSPGFGSVALVAIVPDTLWPAVTSGIEKGLLMKLGGPLTLSSIVALAPCPFGACANTVKVFVPTSPF